MNKEESQRVFNHHGTMAEIADAFFSRNMPGYSHSINARIGRNSNGALFSVQDRRPNMAFTVFPARNLQESNLQTVPKNKRKNTTTALQCKRRKISKSMKRKRVSTEKTSAPKNKRKKTTTALQCKRRKVSKSNEKKKGLTEKKLKKLLEITPYMQNARYLGNIPQLRSFLIEKGYHKKKGVFKATKRWLKKKGQPYLNKTLRNGGKESDWTVDHIVSAQRGGIDWPHNYLMPQSLNSYFGKYNSATKEKYIGKEANNGAEELARWGSKKLASSKNDLSKFDPIGL